MRRFLSFLGFILLSLIHVYATDVVDKLDTIIPAPSSDICDCSIEINTARVVQTDLKKKLENSQVQLSSLENHRSEEIAEIQNELQSAGRDREQCQTTIKSLENKIIDIQVKNEKETEHLGEKYFVLDMAYTESKKKLEIAEVQLTSFEESLAHFKSELTKSQNKFNFVSQEKEQCQMTVETLESDRIDTGKKNLKKTVYVEDKVKVLEKAEAESKKKLEDAKMQMTSFKNSFAHSKAEITRIDRELQTIIEDEKQCQTAVKSMETEKIDMKARYELKNFYLKEKISKHASEKKKQDRVIDQSRERYHDTRKELTDLNAELRKMHRNAMTTYFNFSLIYENTIISPANNLVIKSERKLRQMSPTIHKYKWRARNLYRSILMFFDPYYQRLKDMYSYYLYPNYVRYIYFYINYLIKSIEKFIDAHFSDLVIYIKENWTLSIESMRLTTVALLEEGSRVVMTYFELTKEEYEDFQPLTSFFVKSLRYINQHADDIVYYSGKYILGFICLKYALRMFRLVIYVPFQLMFRLTRKARKIKAPSVSMGRSFKGKKK